MAKLDAARLGTQEPVPGVRRTDCMVSLHGSSQKRKICLDQDVTLHLSLLLTSAHALCGANVTTHLVHDIRVRGAATASAGRPAERGIRRRADGAVQRVQGAAPRGGSLHYRGARIWLMFGQLYIHSL